MDPFVLDLDSDIVSTETTSKDIHLSYMKGEGSQKVLAEAANSVLYAGQPVQHVQALNNATNLNQIASALESLRVDPNVPYKVKLEMLSHSQNVYTEYFSYLLKSATNQKDLTTITQAKEGLSYCHNVLPKLIETIPNKPTMGKL